MDKLDQLHVVSDLHLGGVPGHQIFNQAAALARVIDHLAAAAPEKRVGLVLDGDIVDFLAAEDAKHFDPEGAADKLGAIMADPAIAPVFDALGRFTARPRRLLVLVLGNHDVELALPEVLEVLLDRVCADDAARGRVRVAMDGTGYACKVGERRVLCVHGNEADPWNVVDHAALRAFIRAQNHAAADAEEPATNAGTRLVVDVMNAVKRSYPFVDLLKPETVPVPGVLLALPANLHAPLLDFARIMTRLGWDAGRRGAGFLGGGAAPEDGYRALDRLVRAAAPAREGEPATAWLARADEDFRAGSKPRDLADDGGGMLGMSGLVWDRIRGRDPRDNLREALASYLAEDRTFDWRREDDVFRALDEGVGADVRFIVAGHTHLERKNLRKSGGVYFNSGTWIRLIRIPAEVLASRDAFDPVFAALSAGSLAALDAAPGLVLQRRTLVSIWTEGGETHGELRHALPADVAGSPPWEPVPETRFPR